MLMVYIISVIVFFLAVNGMDEMTMSFRPSSAVCAHTSCHFTLNSQHKTLSPSFSLPVPLTLPPSSSLLTANSSQSYQMSSGSVKTAPQPSLPPLSPAPLKMAAQPSLLPLSPAAALSPRRTWFSSLSSSPRPPSPPSRERTGWPHPPPVTTHPLPPIHPSRPSRASFFLSRLSYSHTQLCKTNSAVFSCMHSITFSREIHSYHHHIMISIQTL